MKILCVIDSLGSGGAQRQLVGLAKGFKGMGHDVSFLVYHDEDFFKYELNNAKIDIRFIPESNYFKRIIKMRSFIRSGNFEAVLSFLEASNFICEVSGFPYRRWKLVVGERSANPEIKRSLKLRLFRFFHLAANYVVSNSYENLRIVKSVNPLLSAKKCKVILNMVESNKWSPKKDFQIGEGGKLRILVAASHQFLKNAAGLVDAVKNLTDLEKERLRIEWYGDKRNDDSYNEAIEKVKKSNLQDIFVFSNASKDLHLKMQNADMVGLFSFYEGLPNVLCEAMVMAKPIISTKVSGIDKLLDTNPELLFNPTKTHEIERALSYALSLTPEQLRFIGLKNRERGLIMFDENLITKEYLSLLR
jgi:glycosyltransferase involved in cell wall biosynthesis